MSRLQFSDGVTFDTSGELRIERRSDGLYVVGQGMMQAIDSREEGKKLIAEMRLGSSEMDDNDERGPKRPTVRLIGEDGNAFSIIGKVKKSLRSAGYSKEQLDEFQAEAMSGDYDNLLATCMKWVDVE